MKKLAGMDKAFQQTCLSDFFFGNGQSSSTVSTAPISVVEEVKPERHSRVSDQDQEEIDFECPPTPPLAAANVLSLIDHDQKDTGGENWDEGADSKWKCYQNIRKHKRKFFQDQQQIQYCQDILGKV
jgi:hypothetical protein